MDKRVNNDELEDRMEIKLHFNIKPVSFQSKGSKIGYKRKLASMVRNQSEIIFLGEVQVNIEVYSPSCTRMEDSKIGDIDNIIKPILDSFNNVIWLDDKQVQSLLINWLDLNPEYYSEANFSMTITGWIPYKRNELSIWCLDGEYFAIPPFPISKKLDDRVKLHRILYHYFKSLANGRKQLLARGIPDLVTRRRMPMNWINIKPADQWIERLPDYLNSK